MYATLCDLFTSRTVGDIGGDVVSAVVSVWPYHRSMEKRKIVCAYKLLSMSWPIVVSFVRELHPVSTLVECVIRCSRESDGKS